MRRAMMTAMPTFLGIYRSPSRRAIAAGAAYAHRPRCSPNTAPYTYAGYSAPISRRCCRACATGRSAAYGIAPAHPLHIMGTSRWSPTLDKIHTSAGHACYWHGTLKEGAACLFLASQNTPEAQRINSDFSASILLRPRRRWLPASGRATRLRR